MSSVETLNTNKRLNIRKTRLSYCAAINIIKYLQRVDCFKFDKSILSSLVNNIENLIYENYYKYPNNSGIVPKIKTNSVIINSSNANFNLQNFKYKHLILLNNTNISFLPKHIYFNKLSSHNNFHNVTKINDDFLSNKKINAFDMGLFTELISIGNNFLSANKLAEIDLSKSTKLVKIGYGFLQNNNLNKLDLSNLINLESVDAYFGSKNKLNIVILPKSTNWKVLGRDFLAYNELTSINLSDLTKIKTIHQNFLFNNPVNKTIRYEF